MSKKIELGDLLNSTALKESGLLYIIVVAITVSNLVMDLNWMQILALCLSFLGVLFGGYIKKAAELKMAEVLKANKEKDDEIIDLKTQVADLKQIKAKLMDEVKNEVMKLIPTMEFKKDEKSAELPAKL